MRTRPDVSMRHRNRARSSRSGRDVSFATDHRIVPSVSSAVTVMPALSSTPSNSSRTASDTSPASSEPSPGYAPATMERELQDELRDTVDDIAIRRLHDAYADIVNRRAWSELEQ